MGGLIDERPVYLEAEWGVLGALIVDAAYCAAEIFLDVRADEFECKGYESIKICMGGDLDDESQFE